MCLALHATLFSGLLAACLLAFGPSARALEDTIEQACSAIVASIRATEDRGALSVALRIDADDPPIAALGHRVEAACETTILAAGFGAVASIHGQAEDLGVRGFDLLVSVQLTTENFGVRSRAIVSRHDRGWQAPTVPREEATTSVLVPVDASLRGILGPLPALRIRAQQHRLSRNDYAAIATLPEPQGSRVLVLVAPNELDIVRVDEHGMVPLQTIALEADGSPAPSRRLVVTSTHEATSGRLELSTMGKAVDLMVGPDGVEAHAVERACGPFGFGTGNGVCAWQVEGRDYFQLEAPSEDENASRPRFYSVRQKSFLQADGSERVVRARIDIRGQLEVDFPPLRSPRSIDVGAPIAIADLDQDGSPEFLLSGPRSVGEGDQLDVFRITGASLESIWSSGPIPGAVLAMTEGDINGDGIEELLALESPQPNRSAHLWIVGR